MIRRAKPYLLFALAAGIAATANAGALDPGPEKRLCATKPAQMTALLRASTQARAVPLRQRLTLQLAPEKAVVLPGTSADLDRERAKVRGATFAGVVRLHVERPRSYRIALDRDAWLDVVAETGKLIDPAPDEATFHCGGAQKVIVYQLPAFGNYWLQIALSPRRETLLTVIPVD